VRAPGTGRRAALAAALFGALVGAWSHVSAGAHSGAAAGIDPAFPAGLDSYSRGLQPGCVAGATLRGKRIGPIAAGHADLRSRTALTPSSVFNVASVSKQFTAFAVLLLEERGVLSLDDPVVRFVPELADTASRATLRHLIHHTSGLRDYAWLNRLSNTTSARSTRDIVALLAQQKGVNSPPGTAYSYSNSGYVLLAAVVERASGMPFAQFARANLFEPLSMRNSRVVERYPPDGLNAATGYIESDGDFAPDVRRLEPAGDSQVHTTAGDLLLWADSLRTGKLGGEGLMRRVRAPGTLLSGATLPYAAGLEVRPFDGLESLSHSGESGGFVSHLLMLPGRSLDVAVLCNRSDAPVTRHARDFARSLLGHESRAEAAPPSIGDLQSVPDRAGPAALPMGDYRNPQTGAYLRLAGDAASRWIEAYGGVAMLVERAPRVFALEEEGHAYAHAAFIPSGGGKAPYMEIRSGGERDVYVLSEPWRPDSLEPYTGCFRSAEAGARCSIRASGNSSANGVADGLELEGCGPPVRLRTGAVREFVSEGGEMSLRFPEAPRPERFQLFSWGARGLEFQREPAAACSSR
jgi:CubicO group peptidase (beta-lactamase class C family)